MPRERYLTDPSHGRPIPQGTTLAAALRQVFARMAQATRFNAREWLPVMMQAVTPAYAQLMQGGMRRAQREIMQAVRQRRRPKTFARLVRKDAPSLAMLFGDFDVFNPKVLEHLRREVFNFCSATLETIEGDVERGLENFRLEISEGLQGGETGLSLNRRIMGIIADPERAARCATTECLPGDTLICGGNITGAFRRYYRGPMIRVITENGLNLTGSINHPVLTARGWVPFGELRKTDYLVSDSNSINGRRASHGVHEDAPQTSIDEIFKTLSAVSVLDRRRTGNPDFHGDGQDGYVDILAADGVLRYGRLATAKQLLKNLRLPTTDKAFRFGLGRGGVLGGKRIVSEPDGVGMTPQQCAGRLDDSFYRSPVRTVLGCQLDEASSSTILIGDSASRKIDPRSVRSESTSEFGNSGFREGSCDASIATQIDDDGLVATESLRERNGAFASDIKFDRVLSLNAIEWSGHVYNLSTVDGFYNANGLYTKNSSRAMHGGSMLAAAESNVVTGKYFISSSDACDLCLSLARMGTIDLDKPFYVHPKGGPYAVIMHAPAHPWCQCSGGFSFDDDEIESLRMRPLSRFRQGRAPREWSDILGNVPLAASYRSAGK